MHRQGGQIGIASREHDLVHRSLRGGHLDRGDGLCEALAQRGGQAGFIGIERRGKPPTGAHHVADQLGPLRAGRVEPHGGRIAVEHACHVDEVNRRVVYDAFALLHELLDETAQAEPLGVGSCGVGLGHGRRCAYTLSMRSQRS